MSSNKFTHGRLTGLVLLDPLKTVQKRCFWMRLCRNLLQDRAKGRTRGEKPMHTRACRFLPKSEPTTYCQRSLALPLGQSVACCCWPIYRPLALIPLIQSNHKPMSPIQFERKAHTVDHPKITPLIIDSYVIFWALFHLKNGGCIFGNDTTTTTITLLQCSTPSRSITVLVSYPLFTF